jgi:quercetin dioxygenase-like cupin family protein
METSYASQGLPHNLNDNADIASYQHFLANPPGISIPGGTVVRFLDLKPGATSPLHRSITVDCGVIIDGEVKLELDSGESKILKKGDVIVQRATNHAWHNVSETETVRMVFFIQPAEPLEVAGKKLVDA